MLKIILDSMGSFKNSGTFWKFSNFFQDSLTFRNCLQIFVSDLFLGDIEWNHRENTNLMNAMNNSNKNR